MLVLEYSDLKSSLARAKEEGDFYHLFYGILLSSSAKVKQRFIYSDLGALRTSFQSTFEDIFEYAIGQQQSSSKMDMLRLSHSKNYIGIEPGLYRHWVDSLLRTLEVLDPEYNPDLEQSWRLALNKVVNYMAAGYEEEGE